MDDSVIAALKRWPSVPACRGWLGLDRRGDWYMRDERVQATGPFPHSRGSRIEHEKLREFIERNYESDGQGAWFFQNGPQRVYVELEVAPWIWRLGGAPEAPTVASHTGLAVQAQAAMLDEAGRLFLQTDAGVGLVHAQDMWHASMALEAARWPLQEVRYADLLQRTGWVLSPASAPG